MNTPQTTPNPMSNREMNGQELPVRFAWANSAHAGRPPKSQSVDSAPVSSPSSSLWIAGPSALFGVAVGAGFVVRDCALSCNVGYTAVPWAWIAIALAALPCVALQVHAGRRLGFDRWLVAAPLLVAAGLVLTKVWTGLAVDAYPYAAPGGPPVWEIQAPYLAYAVWIDPALVCVATNLVVLTHRIRGPQGLTLLGPSILGGAIAGSGLAGLVPPALVQAGVRYEHARDALLVVMALLLCLQAAVLRRAVVRFPATPGPEAAPPRLLAELGRILSARRTALALLVLVGTGLAAVLVEYLFLGAVSREVAAGADSGRTAWFATFYLVLNVVTLALLLFGTPRLIARLGLTLALVLLPLLALLGGAWLAAAPAFLAVCALRLGRDGLTKSLFEPATERLVAAVAGERYDAVRTVIGGLGFSLGMGLGGALLLALGRLGVEAQGLAWLLAGVSFVWGVVALAAGRAAA